MTTTKPHAVSFRRRGPCTYLVVSFLIEPRVLFQDGPALQGKAERTELEIPWEQDECEITEMETSSDSIEGFRSIKRKLPARALWRSQAIPTVEVPIVIPHNVRDLASLLVGPTEPS